MILTKGGLLSKYLAILVASVLALAALAGCGGGDDADGETAEAPPISKAQFLKKAEAICKQHREKYFADATPRILKAEREGVLINEDFEVPLIKTLLVASMKDKVADIRALGAPKGDEAQVDAILVAIEEVIEAARTNPRKFRQEQSDFEHPFEKARNLAKKYGLEECAQA